MSESIRITIENISKIVAILGGLINGFKFLRNLDYKDKLGRYYGFDGNNLDSFTWINSSEFIQGIVQIFIMIIMFYSINTTKDLSSNIIKFLNFVFIVLMLTADILASKKSGDILTIVLGAIIFLVIYVVLFKSEEYGKLNSNEKRFVINLLVYIVLVIISLTQVINSLFPNFENKKTYEIIRVDKTNEDKNDNEELFVKIARIDDGFISFRCKILNKDDIPKDVYRKIRSKKHKKSDIFLFIEKGRYRYIDPKKATIENILFDDAIVLKRKRKKEFWLNLTFCYTLKIILVTRYYNAIIQ